MAYDYKGQVIRRGSGNVRATRVLQQMLQDAGYNPGPIDGAFGPKTEAALRKFQANNGLDPDMIAGKDTWARLENARPQPLDNPKRYMARGALDDTTDEMPSGEDQPEPMPATPAEPMFQGGPANPTFQTGPGAPPQQIANSAASPPPPGPPEVTLTDPTVPYTRHIDLGGISDGGRLLRFNPGDGPAAESSSSSPAPEEDPAVAQALQALATQRGKLFIADYLAQQQAQKMGRSPALSPAFGSALGGQVPNFVQPFLMPGAPPDLPSTIGMPSWLNDRVK